MDMLVIEAMKMQNMIKSPMDGVIKSIHVKKDENVHTDQLLVEF